LKLATKHWSRYLVSNKLFSTAFF